MMKLTFLKLRFVFSNCAASILWSVYCPSLRDTGMVSSATGFLDFVSYMAAAASSTLFANSVSTIGWKNLILIWFFIVLAGVAVSFIPKSRKAD
jgi:sugar phosphate permease